MVISYDLLDYWTVLNEIIHWSSNASPPLKLRHVDWSKIIQVASRLNGERNPRPSQPVTWKSDLNTTLILQNREYKLL